MLVDRRLLLKGATLGLGALAVPGWAQVMNARGFTHSVASGEPGHDRVLLWTRYVPDTGGGNRLSWHVAESPDFGRILAKGEIAASPEHDFCVKPVAEGLAPGRWYFYRFLDERGGASPIGRTRTLPQGSTERFTLGVFSCSNLPFGYFNAYAHAAARRDVDLMVHVGDYLYEYERGEYPSAGEALAGREIEPANEIVSLADYRMRFASYRLDPDLQELHRMFPMIAMWDDHESANDSWQGGAENHQPDKEGDWNVRKAASVRAYREWMPVSEENWASYRIGDLAELYRLESRLTARSQQLSLGAFLQGKQDLPAALADFRDRLWRAQDRTLLGAQQEAWLAEGLRRSVADKVRWQVIGQQVVMGTIATSPALVDVLMSGASEETRRKADVGLAAARAGLPSNLDSWDGYPAARARLLRASLEADAELIVLSGDSHNAWAFDLDHDGQAAGVEFAGHSVTSPGYYEHSFKADPLKVADALVGSNPQCKWMDSSQRGYLTVSLSPERAVGEWTFLQTILRRDTALAGIHRMSVAHGARRLENA